MADVDKSPPPAPAPKRVFSPGAAASSVRGLAASVSEAVADAEKGHRSLKDTAPQHGHSRLSLDALRRAEAGLVHAAQALGEHAVHGDRAAETLAKHSKENVK